jgi:hypothetical protein
MQHTALSVVGLKGTMSEAELHVLQARLRGGLLNKARRGEYRCPLPTGLVYDEAGNVVLDPDTQVRESISYFFETFSRVGSACQTVKDLRFKPGRHRMVSSRSRATLSLSLWEFSVSTLVGRLDDSRTVMPNPHDGPGKCRPHLPAGTEIPPK